jgi:hypothetical protein
MLEGSVIVMGKMFGANDRWVMVMGWIPSGFGGVRVPSRKSLLTYEAT